MILLDSDLEPDAAQAGIRRGKRSAVPVFQAPSRQYNLPTARTLRRFLGEAQAAVGLRGQVTVLLTTDAAIRRLNRKFRGKNKATDVLSFPAEVIGAEEIAGDLAISVPTALRQAAEQGHALSVEIKVLMLHGLLHLAGHDHEKDRGQMARRERILRGKLSLPHGLIERAGASVSPAGPKPADSVGLIRRAETPRSLRGAKTRGLQRPRLPRPFKERAVSSRSADAETSRRAAKAKRP